MATAPAGMATRAGHDRAAPSRGQSWGGISVAVASAAMFGTSGTFGTSLLDAGWTPASAVLARIVLGGVLLTIPALVALRGRWTTLRRSAGTAIGYGIVGVAGCQVCYFNAITRMPVGIALLIEYTGSILVVAWLWLRHGQRPRRLTIAGAAAAVAGLALMVTIGGSGQDSAGLSPLGLAWAIAAAVSMAVYFLISAGPPPAGTPQAPLPEAVPPETVLPETVLPETVLPETVLPVTGPGAATGTRPAGPGAASGAVVSEAVASRAVTPAAAGGGEDAALPPIVLAWAGMWVGAATIGLLLLVHALPAGASLRDVTLLRHPVPVFVPIAGVALLATAAGYSTGIIAARRLGAKVASFIGMAEILFAVLYAWALLGQLPAATQFAGGALILAGVTLVKADES